MKEYSPRRCRVRRGCLFRMISSSYFRSAYSVPPRLATRKPEEPKFERTPSEALNNEIALVAVLVSNPHYSKSESMSSLVLKLSMCEKRNLVGDSMLSVILRLEPRPWPGPRSGFRPAGVLECATGLPVGLHFGGEGRESNPPGTLRPPDWF